VNLVAPSTMPCVRPAQVATAPTFALRARTNLLAAPPSPGSLRSHGLWSRSTTWLDGSTWQQRRQQQLEAATRLRSGGSRVALDLTYAAPLLMRRRALWAQLLDELRERPAGPPTQGIGGKPILQLSSKEHSTDSRSRVPASSIGNTPTLPGGMQGGPPRPRPAILLDHRLGRVVRLR